MEEEAEQSINRGVLVKGEGILQERMILSVTEKLKYIATREEIFFAKKKI